MVNKMLKDRFVGDNLFTPITDEDAVLFLTKEVAHTGECAEMKVKAWRVYAQKKNYDGPIAWKAKDILVFWVPRLVEEGLGKSDVQMAELREELRKSHGLPDGHCDRFGSFNLLFALLVAHAERGGEQTQCFAASDTLIGTHYRQLIGFLFGEVMPGDYWNGDGFGGASFFLLGVEEPGCVQIDQ